jgi:formylglycine-generating enzyme required for sulfatase activity
MFKVRHIVVASVAALSGFALCFGDARATDADAVAPPATVPVPAGPFIAGSSADERDYGYRLDEASYGHDRTRKQGWYDRERDRESASTAAFSIMRSPVTNAEYARFVEETGHAAPDVAPATWQSYRLIHPYERTRRHAWSSGKPPPGRDDHPVVMVSWDDAAAYAAWLSARTGMPWRLPTELEWEKTARGVDGRIFPWGDEFDPERLNSHDLGPFDTVAVGSFPSGASPFGALDMSGQVYEWTASPAPGDDRYLVKGGSWDDKGCGVCRAAARHGRPAALKHILVGFRLVADSAAPLH